MRKIINESRSAWMPLAAIVIMSFIMILPQLITGSTIVGSDGLFHFNRIYDTAKQLSTGHWSYWQSNFGFQQSGRVVNAVYGPYFAYLMGALLVVLRSWYHFQLVTTFAIYLVGGFGMYSLARVAGTKRWPALTAALILMNIGWLPRWGYNQNMTGIGAALLPYALACGVYMVRHRERPIRPVRLAFIMAILLQTHILSTLFAVLALVPFWLVAFIRTPRRLRMLGQTTIAVGIATILTANVWGALLLLFSTNHIAYPHAFSLAQNVLQLTVGPGKRNAITLVTAMIMGAQVVLLVARGRRNSRINWGVTVMGGGTLWLASRFCPWVTIGRLVPKLSQLLQFPVRLTSVAFPLMLCGLALSMSTIHWHAHGGPTLLVPALASVAVLGVAVPNVYRMAYRSVQVQHHRVLRNFGALLLVNSSPHTLRSALNSSHPGAILVTAEKHSSDYLPVNGRQGPGTVSPGAVFTREVLFKHPYFTYTALSGGRLRIRWNETMAGWQTIPVVTYHQTTVTVNGRRLNRNQYYRSRINAPIVQSRAGRNTMVIRFQTPPWTTVLLWLAPVGWLSLAAVVVWRRRNNWRTSSGWIQRNVAHAK